MSLIYCVWYEMVEMTVYTRVCVSEYVCAVLQLIS